MGGMTARTNTMPQWAGSLVLPTVLDPDNSEEACPLRRKSIDARRPYVGGAEHAVLHLLTRELAQSSVRPWTCQ